MTEQDEIWQRRIEQLYANVAELYSHVEITVVMFDRHLVEIGAADESRAGPLAGPLAEVARRVLATGAPERDIALDPVGRQRVHSIPLHADGSVIAVVCVVDDDGARRELFVRCAMAIFDGYRRHEADLLERERRALEEARRANQMRDRFMALVAHELRSPMASILLWEEVLRNPALDASMRTAALDAIHASAAGQALLVADLVDVSRAINGKLHVERERTDIARVLALAIENARPHATASGLEIVAHLDPALGTVLGDSRRLGQVFDNLLSNAVKCTERGRISIRAWPQDIAIVIEVSDTGRGIAPDFLARMFEPFEQADENDPGGGLGLGLGIARQLVELHDGTLTASSAGIGHGAQFEVRLPRMPTEGDDEPLARPIAGIRVLVVDDDARILEALRLLLGRAGALVSTARSAASARAIVQRGHTDILVSDIGMPSEDGLSLVRSIRAAPGAAQRLPVVAITAQAGDDSRERAIAAGFDRYLTKPIEMELLVATIAQLAG